MKILLQNAIISSNAGSAMTDDQLKDAIIKEYQALDNKFHISNEYEKTQVISNIYSYLSNCSHIEEPSGDEELKEDFLATDLKEYLSRAREINLYAKVNSNAEKYAKNFKSHCKYCSSRDVCMPTSRN